MQVNNIIDSAKNISLRKQSGMTLVELLISLGVGSLLIIVILNVFSGLINTQRLLLAFNRLEINTHRILNQMQDDIRWAQEIQVPDSRTLEIYTHENDLVIYRWQEDQQVLIRRVNDEEKVVHPEGMQTADFDVSQLRPDPEDGYLPLVRLLITMVPSDSKLKGKLVLEKQITYTNKQTRYAI